MQGVEIEFIAWKMEAAEGKIRHAEGKSGLAAVKIRSAAGDFVPGACEIGRAACVSGVAEERFGAAERDFRIPERRAGRAAMKIRSAERIFATAAAIQIRMMSVTLTKSRRRGRKMLGEFSQAFPYQVESITTSGLWEFFNIRTPGAPWRSHFEN
jgi:hypothetical protein